MSYPYGPWSPPPGYGGQGERIVYVPMPQPQQPHGHDDPVEALEKQVMGTKRLIDFIKAQNKEEKKEEKAKKVLGLPEKDIMWILLLTAPLTGWVMCNFYVNLLTHWPTLVK